MNRGSCGNPACGRPSPDPICWECTRQLADELGQIPDLADLLAAAAHTTHSTGDGGTPHYPPLPFDADMTAFGNELHTNLVACARDLMETREIPFMPLGYAKRDLIGPLPQGIRHLPCGHIATTGDIALWLRHHIRQLRMLDSAGETALDVHRFLEHGLTLAAGGTIPVYRGPCPTLVRSAAAAKAVRCDNPLYAPRQAAIVDCRRCKTSHDAGKLEDRYMSDLSQMLFRFSRLQGVLRELGEPVTDRTLSAWIRAGRIKAAGWQRPDGTITTTAADARPGEPPMYRLADVRRVRAESRAGKGKTA
ncbi:hypothetical protein [Nocardia tengchongensis]|uniref:hypothetical protein n=1 Tax=Nocardia tengchongensis TaxID=2055889 RepID=UPI0036AE6D8E